MPVITLARQVSVEPDARLLLLADDPAAETDIPAWCALRGRTLAWVGPAPDGVGRGYLVIPPEQDPPELANAGRSASAVASRSR